MLYYCALGIVKSPADAEDVLQNAFIKIAENLNNIKEPDSKSTAAYLTVITKIKEVSFEEADVCIEDNFIEQIALKTDYKRPVDCIKSIPSPYNEVLFLHFVAVIKIKIR